MSPDAYPPRLTSIANDRDHHAVMDGRTITTDPGRVAQFQMNREAAAEFKRDKTSPMLRNSPELRMRRPLDHACRMAGRNGDPTVGDVVAGVGFDQRNPHADRGAKWARRMVGKSDRNHHPVRFR